MVAYRHTRILFTKDACIETSAFAVVIWYTYRDQNMLRFSALVRTIVKQATIYFIVIVAVQIYLQVYLSLGIVWPRPLPVFCHDWLTYKHDLYSDKTFLAVLLREFNLQFSSWGRKTKIIPLQRSVYCLCVTSRVHAFSRGNTTNLCARFPALILS